MAAKVNVGDGKKARFWDAPWLDGRQPMDIAPLVYEGSNRKKCTVHKALYAEFWFSQFNTQNGLSLEHIVQFANLWEMLQSIHLDPNNEDSISWKFTNDGIYSSESAYGMQFFGQTKSSITSLVRKPWAPPKCKSFAWLIIQNRVWTADRLQRRGWPNCGIL
jgi:hypothetical protein